MVMRASRTILAHAPFFDIAVTAIDLLSATAWSKPLSVNTPLTIGVTSRAGRLPPGVPPRRSNDVQCPIAVRSKAEGAAGFVIGADRQQRTTDIGVNDDRVRLLVRMLGTGERTGLIRSRA